MDVLFRAGVDCSTVDLVVGRQGAEVMPEYDIAFGEKLAEVANFVVADGLSDLDAKRTVLYLSLLSTEISLKSMLEQAGKPVKEIRERTHKLTELLTDLGQCRVEVEVVPGTRKLVPASRLRSCSLDHGEARTTVGTVIDAESQGASKYPNQVRYGDLLSHYPPEVVAQMASKVAAFAREHWQSLRAK